jgi:hypothetical protein
MKKLIVAVVVSLVLASLSACTGVLNPGASINHPAEGYQIEGQLEGGKW